MFLFGMEIPKRCIDSVEIGRQKINTKVIKNNEASRGLEANFAIIY